MKLWTLGCAAGLGLFTVVPARGAIVISEALANEVSSDTLGEFMEIFNTGPNIIDLSSYKIGDEENSSDTGTGEAMHRFPAGATIAPGEVQVIAGSAARFFEVYGFQPDYERSGSDATVPDLATYSAWDSDGGVGAMANGNDQLLVLDGSDNIVDAVSWGNTFAFNPGIVPPSPAVDGQSFERANVYIDTDTAADWQYGPTSTSAAARSTPGVANVPEPASIGLALLGGVLTMRRPRRLC